MPATRTVIDSPVGRLGLMAEGSSLTEVHFHATEPVTPGGTRLAPVLREACKQLAAYFSGTLRVFTVPLAPHGTPFQITVWSALEQIPYGQTLSYRDLAESIGRPLAVRAVGAANGRNPIPIFIPCHRVIGSDGKLVGFGGGLQTKRLLLDLEGGWRLF